MFYTRSFPTNRPWNSYAGVESLFDKSKKIKKINRKEINNNNKTSYTVFCTIWRLVERLIHFWNWKLSETRNCAKYKVARSYSLAYWIYFLNGVFSRKHIKRFLWYFVSQIKNNRTLRALTTFIIITIIKKKNFDPDHPHVTWM